MDCHPLGKLDHCQAAIGVDEGGDLTSVFGQQKADNLAFVVDSQGRNDALGKSYWTIYKCRRPPPLRSGAP